MRRNPWQGPKRKCPATPARVLGVADSVSIDRSTQSTCKAYHEHAFQAPLRVQIHMYQQAGTEASPIALPTQAQRGGSAMGLAKRPPLVLMRNYEPLFPIRWKAGCSASRCNRWRGLSSPKAARLNASESGRMTVTFRSGNPRSTARPAMAVCKPAGASGPAQSVLQRSRSGAELSFWTLWSCIRPKAARSTF